MSFDLAKKEERLATWCELLEDALNDRYTAVADVIEKGWSLYRSPFAGGPTIEEQALFPLCIRLGVAVRLVDAEMKLPERGDEGTFIHEIELMVPQWPERFGLSEDVLRPESVWWEQIIPGSVALGYYATSVPNA